MEQVTTVGIDLAKRVFHVCGRDAAGRVILERRFSRAGLQAFMAALAPAVVGLEACGGAHDWGRRLRALGHEVRLMHPARVAAYVGAHKNDRADARAICEAAGRPAVRSIPVKTVDQQALQALHRLRGGLVKERTAAINRMRGILQEFGVTLPKGRAAFLRRYPDLAAMGRLDELPAVLVDELDAAFAALAAASRRIAKVEGKILALARADVRARRLMEVEGIGRIGASALVAAVDDARAFRNGRAFAAWLGLVPRQRSTGGTPRLLGISKRGDSHIRLCLVHGARAVLTALRRRGPRTPLERWAAAKADTMHPNKLAVAVANKLARYAWVIMARDQPYRPKQLTSKAA